MLCILSPAPPILISERERDKYRESLQALAKDLGVENQVIFHNRFVSPEEMMEFIGSADIYITPYRMRRRLFRGLWHTLWARAKR